MFNVDLTLQAANGQLNKMQITSKTFPYLISFRGTPKRVVGESILRKACLESCVQCRIQPRQIKFMEV